MFITLSKAGYNIIFTKVNGSHSSIEKNQADRTDEENLGNIIFWALVRQFQNFNNITFIEPQNNLTLVPLYDYYILGMHGDQGNIQKLASFAKLFNNKKIIEIEAGHIHHRKVEDLGKITVHYNECLCGPDQYAIDKGLNSEPGVRYVQYNKDGRFKDQFIKIR